MTPPINIDGTQITGASIDGSKVEEITVDGTQVFSAGPPDSRVLRYEFEDDSDTTVAVDSGGEFDGSIVGGQYVTDSAVGNLALSMDDADDEVDTGFFYDDENQAISFSVRLKTSNSAGALLGSRGIDSADSSASHTSFDLTSGNLKLDIDDPGGGNNEKLPGTVSVNDGTFHHLVYVFDNPNDTATLYVDGSEDASGSISNDGTQDGVALHLNNRKNAAGTGQLGGIYDDPRVYLKALTASEVSDLFNTGSI